MKKIIYLVLAAGLLTVNLGPFLELLAVRGETARLEAEIESMARKNRLLREEVRRLESDAFEIERTARRELGLIREGEWIIRKR